MISWIKRFFEEENGKPSLMRLYSVPALLVAGKLSLVQKPNIELITIWLIAAFVPKVLQKLAEAWALPKGGKQ